MKEQFVPVASETSLVNGRRMLEVLSASEAAIIRRLLATSQDGLQQQLAGFELRLKRGETGGGGVVGQITECLLSQPGLTRQERTC